jgi:hypothetical protein
LAVSNTFGSTSLNSTGRCKKDNGGVEGAQRN